MEQKAQRETQENGYLVFERTHCLLHIPKNKKEKLLRSRQSTCLSKSFPKACGTKDLDNGSR